MGKFNDIVKSSTPTLVDFHATWCGPCQAMHPVMDRLKNEMGSQVRILKIDVDKNQEVANKFKVRSVPTFMLFKDGEILWKQSGGMDINTLKSKIKAAGGVKDIETAIKFIEAGADRLGTSSGIQLVTTGKMKVGEGEY